MTDLNVLYFHTRLETPGGANRFVVETARRLTEAEVSVTLATGTLDQERYPLPEDVSLFEYGGLPPSVLSHWISLPVLGHRLRTALADRSFDVVMFHSIPLPYWTPFLRRLLPKAQFYWFAHDPNSYLNSPGKLADVPTPLRTLLRVGLPIIRFGDRRLITHLDGVIANSKYTASVIKQVYGHDSLVVYPGVDTTKFTPENADTDPNQAYVFTVGQLNEFNNFDLLLRAVAHADDIGANIPQLVVGGEGPASPSLRRKALRLGIEDQVRFTGYLSEAELQRHYATARAVAYLPSNEPFGLVPVEAMASGTPVVTLDNGGPKETVVNATTGQLTEATPAAVADALAEVTVPKTSEQMGQAAREHVVERFTWELTSDALLSVIESVQ